MPVIPVLAPGRAAAQDHVEDDEQGRHEQDHADAHVEAGVVRVVVGRLHMQKGRGKCASQQSCAFSHEVYLIVVGIVVELGALDGTLIRNEIAGGLVAHVADRLGGHGHEDPVRLSRHYEHKTDVGVPHVDLDARVKIAAIFATTKVSP